MCRLPLALARGHALPDPTALAHDINKAIGAVMGAA